MRLCKLCEFCPLVWVKIFREFLSPFAYLLVVVALGLDRNAIDFDILKAMMKPMMYYVLCTQSVSHKIRFRGMPLICLETVSADAATPRRPKVSQSTASPRDANTAPPSMVARSMVRRSSDVPNSTTSRRRVRPATPCRAQVSPSASMPQCVDASSHVLSPTPPRTPATPSPRVAASLKPDAAPLSSHHPSVAKLPPSTLSTKPIECFTSPRTPKVSLASPRQCAGSTKPGGTQDVLALSEASACVSPLPQSALHDPRHVRDNTFFGESHC